MKPPNRKSCYNFRVTEVVKVIDGDTIDVVIDLGFDLYKKERVRIAGVDTPEREQETQKKKHSVSMLQSGCRHNYKKHSTATAI